MGRRHFLTPAERWPTLTPPKRQRNAAISERQQHYGKPHIFKHHIVVERRQTYEQGAFFIGVGSKSNQLLSPNQVIGTKQPERSKTQHRGGVTGSRKPGCRYPLLFLILLTLNLKILRSRIRHVRSMCALSIRTQFCFSDIVNY